MRMVFGVLGLLVVVAIVGMVAKSQLRSMSQPTAAATSGSDVPAPAGTPKQQVDQVKQSVESVLQQPRPSADDPK